MDTACAFRAAAELIGKSKQVIADRKAKISPQLLTQHLDRICDDGLCTLYTSMSCRTLCHKYIASVAIDDQPQCNVFDVCKGGTVGSLNMKRANKYIISDTDKPIEPYASDSGNSGLHILEL